MNKKIFISLIISSILLVSCSSYDLSKLSNSPSTINNNNNNTNDDTNNNDTIDSEENLVTKQIIVSENSLPNISDYSTGNYSNIYKYNSDDSNINVVDNITFMHYRAVNEIGSAIKLLPYYTSENDGTIPGAFFNTTAINNIRNIAINYESNLGLSLTISKTQSFLETNTLKAEGSNSEAKSVDFNVKEYDPYFFKIETVGSELSINSITISYVDKSSPSETTYKKSGEGKTRSKIECSNELIEGKSIATLKDKDGNEKTYTYYTYSYCKDNETAIDDACLTDPVDVANYYLAFGEAPANYGSEKNSTNDLFNDNARQVSDIYNYTSGYVNAISGGATDPKYIELDIAIGGDYTSRGVGRIVIFLEGLNEYSNSGCVAFFTDDHYATFKEYLNDGTFGPRFNAQCLATSYVHSKPSETTTINLD